MLFKAATLTLTAALVSLTACSSTGSGSHHATPVPPAASTITGPAQAPASGPSSTKSATPAGAINTSGWCGELTNEGKSVVDVGNVPAGNPADIKAKVAKLIADAPAEIRPGLRVLQQIENKELDGADSSDAENQLETPANAPLIQKAIEWIETHCGAAALSQ